MSFRNVFMCLGIFIVLNVNELKAHNLTNIYASLANKLELITEELNFLKDVNVEELPRPIRDIVKSTNYGEHMCCRNQPVSLITKSRSVKRISIEKDEIKIGSHSCGLLGTGSCDEFGFKYREVIKYVTEYFKAINYATCPDRHVVCCYLYVMVAGKCVHLDDLHEVALQLLG